MLFSNSFFYSQLRLGVRDRTSVNCIAFFFGGGGGGEGRPSHGFIRVCLRQVGSFSFGKDAYCWTANLLFIMLFLFFVVHIRQRVT